MHHKCLSAWTQFHTFWTSLASEPVDQMGLIPPRWASTESVSPKSVQSEGRSVSEPPKLRVVLLVVVVVVVGWGCCCNLPLGSFLLDPCLKWNSLWCSSCLSLHCVVWTEPAAMDGSLQPFWRSQHWRKFIKERLCTAIQCDTIVLEHKGRRKEQERLHSNLHCSVIQSGKILRITDSVYGISIKFLLTLWFVPFSDASIFSSFLTSWDCENPSFTSSLVMSKVFSRCE